MTAFGKCFWCGEGSELKFFVNHRSYCSKKCVEESVADCKIRLKTSQKPGGTK